MIEQLMSRLRIYPTEYKTISHAWSLDAIDAINGDMPMALFIPGAIHAEPSESLPIRQRLAESVVVVTLCDWRQLDTLRNQLYGAMLGYQHAPSYAELELRQGEVNRINGSVVQWMDMFTADRWIQPDPEPQEPMLTVDGAGLTTNGAALIAGHDT